MMSSGTSTDAQVGTRAAREVLHPPAGARTRQTGVEGRPPASEPMQPWQLFTLAGLVGATVVVFMSRGQSPAVVIVLSLIIFAAAGVGVAALRMVVPLTGLRPQAVQRVLGGRTRAALERDKQLVLRSIKELEFDHAMGKVSDADFAEMSARLRSRAAGLLRQLDAGAGYRDEIEREVERRVGTVDTVDTAPAAAGVHGDRPPTGLEASTPGPSHDPGHGTAHSAGASIGSTAHVCAACETPNDPDARFCKHCGGRLGG